MHIPYQPFADGQSFKQSKQRTDIYQGCHAWLLPYAGNLARAKLPRYFPLRESRFLRFPGKEP